MTIMMMMVLLNVTDSASGPPSYSYYVVIIISIIIIIMTIIIMTITSGVAELGVKEDADGELGALAVLVERHRERLGPALVGLAVGGQRGLPRSERAREGTLGSATQAWSGLD
jgi:hypothetical protein